MTDESPIRVGKVSGGWAYWCSECKTGQAAMTGLNVLDANTIDQLADWHEFEHHA